MEPYSTIPGGISIPQDGYPEVLAIHSINEEKLTTFCVQKLTNMESFLTSKTRQKWSSHTYVGKYGGIAKCHRMNMCKPCSLQHQQSIEFLTTNKSTSYDGVEQLLKEKKRALWPRHFYTTSTGVKQVCNILQLCQACTQKRKAPFDVINGKLQQFQNKMRALQPLHASWFNNALPLEVNKHGLSVQILRTLQSLTREETSRNALPGRPSNESVHSFNSNNQGFFQCNSIPQRNHPLQLAGNGQNLNKNGHMTDHEMMVLQQQKDSVREPSSRPEQVELIVTISNDTSFLDHSFEGTVTSPCSQTTEAVPSPLPLTRNSSRDTIVIDDSDTEDNEGSEWIVNMDENFVDQFNGAKAKVSSDVQSVNSVQEQNTFKNTKKDKSRVDEMEKERFNEEERHPNMEERHPNLEERHPNMEERNPNTESTNVFERIVKIEEDLDVLNNIKENVSVIKSAKKSRCNQRDVTIISFTPKKLNPVVRLQDVFDNSPFNRKHFLPSDTSITTLYTIKNKTDLSLKKTFIAKPKGKSVRMKKREKSLHKKIRPKLLQKTEDNVRTKSTEKQKHLKAVLQRLIREHNSAI